MQAPPAVEVSVYLKAVALVARFTDQMRMRLPKMDRLNVEVRRINPTGLVAIRCYTQPQGRLIYQRIIAHEGMFTQVNRDLNAIIISQENSGASS